LGKHVRAPVDDADCIDTNWDRAARVPSCRLHPCVLLLEVGGIGRRILAPELVAKSARRRFDLVAPLTDSVHRWILSFEGRYEGNLSWHVIYRSVAMLSQVGSLLLKPSLRKMPQGVSAINCSVSCGVLILAGESSDKESVIRFRYSLREVCDGDVGRDLVDGPVGQDVIREPCLDGLVDVEDVDLIVPRPGIKRRAVRVCVNGTRPVLRSYRDQRAESWTPLNDDGQWSFGRILSRLEKPEEEVGRIALEGRFQSCW
jgi:hypothetical protein